MNDTAAIHKEKLVADAKSALENVEAILKQAGETTGQQAHDLRERAAEALHRAKLRLHEAQDALTQSTKAAARATDDWVHEHPWTAVGIGAGVGFLLGLLVSRR